MHNELIARLEAVTGDSVELMREVWLALNPEPPRSWNPAPIQQAILDPELRPAIDKHTAWRRAKERFGWMLAAEAYESAALTLVPEGWLMRLVSFAKGNDPMPVSWRCVLRKWSRSDDGYISWSQVIGVAPTPALAICIAALKAI